MVRRGVLHFINQPERSKREDSFYEISRLVNEELCRRQDAIIKEMRCSEHDGNAVREVQ